MKHKFIAKKHWKSKVSAMGSSDVIAASMDDCINLSIGNPDMTTDQRILDATFEDASNGHTGYTNFQGDPELRAEIRKMYKDEYNMDIDDDQILVASSGSHALHVILATTMDPGDEVIVQAPYFSAYEGTIKANGAVMVELPTYEEEDFQINTDRLESLITERTKALIINTPNNPTGSCLSDETMEKLAEIAVKYDLFIIADDIYTAFSYQHPFKPFASLPGMMERTFTINSFSKDYIMCGWRVSNIILPKGLIEPFLLTSQYTMFCAPSISQRAALHGLRMRKEVQPAVVEEFRSRVYYGAERVNGLKNMHVLYPPKGTFYLWINIKDTGLTSVEACDKILEEAHVLFLPGNAFGECGEGFIRASCTVSVDVLKDAFDRIAKMDMFNPSK